MSDLTTQDYRDILIGITKAACASASNPRVYEYWMRMQSVVSAQMRKHEEGTLKPIKLPTRITVYGADNCFVLQLADGTGRRKCSTCGAVWDADDKSPCEDRG